MSIFLSIIFATTVAGIISILIAATLSFKFLTAIVENMVSFSVGILLATTFLHSLPEAFESQMAAPTTLFSFLFSRNTFLLCFRKNCITTSQSSS
jgi:zinc and cadmium transporter